MKIPQRRLIAEIAAAGYAFSSETKRQRTYRKRGGTHFVIIRKTDLLEEATTRSILRQAGRTPDQIEAFVASCRQHPS